VFAGLAVFPWLAVNSVGVSAGDAPLLVSEYSVAAETAEAANRGARIASDNFFIVLRCMVFSCQSKF
jgi:hypothetical protein